MKSDLLHPASAIIPFPARWHQVSPAGLLLILNLFYETSKYVCLSVRWSECVRLCTCCWAQLAFCRDVMAKDWEIAVESSPKMSIYFPFEAFKQTETIFKKTRKLLVQRLFSILQFSLDWVLFFHIHKWVFCFVFYYAGLALGHARHPQYSGARWMYCCKYIVTLSNAVTVDSLHMYY